MSRLFWRTYGLTVLTALAVPVGLWGDDAKPPVSVGATEPVVGADDPAKFGEAEALRGYVEDDREVLRPTDKDNPFEAAFFDQLVLYARKFSPETLAAASNKEVLFAHIFNDDRWRYRGQLLRLEGRIKRIRKLDATSTLAKGNPEVGIAPIPYLYEAWLFTDDAGIYPCCVLFSDLPHGFKVSEDTNLYTKVDAYFFKRYRYVAADQRVRLAPLLIGHSPLSAPAPPGISFTDFVPLAIIVIGSMVGLALVITLVFRRGDRDLQARVQARSQVNPFTETES